MTETRSEGEELDGMPSPLLVGRTIGFIVLLSVATNYHAAMAHELGSFEPKVEGLDPVLRLLREVVIWSSGALMVNGIARHKRLTGQGVSLSFGVAGAGMVALGCVASTIARGGNLELILPGLRALPLLLILAGLVHYRQEHRLIVGRVVARAAIAFLLVETLFATRQVLAGVPPMYGTTFIGPRPYGTMATPNLLGIAALGCLLLFLMTRPKRLQWLVLTCLVLSFASGSRTAVMGCLIVLLGSRAGAIKFRWLLVPNALAVTYAIYLSASSQAISGRVIQSEGRFEAWRIAVAATIHTPLDWAFGAGVGVGTNAARALVLDPLTGRPLPITDSTVIAVFLSFGLAGLSIAALGLLRFVRALDSRGWMIAPTILLVVLTLNLPEVAPFNALVLVAAALGLPQDRCSFSGRTNLISNSSQVRPHSHGNQRSRRRLGDYEVAGRHVVGQPPSASSPTHN